MQIPRAFLRIAHLFAQILSLWHIYANPAHILAAMKSFIFRGGGGAAIDKLKVALIRLIKQQTNAMRSLVPFSLPILHNTGSTSFTTTDKFNISTFLNLLLSLGRFHTWPSKRRYRKTIALFKVLLPSRFRLRTVKSER